MNLFKMASALLFALVLLGTTKGQTSSPAPYCSAKHYENYNMIDSMKFESAYFEFGAVGSVTDSNDFIYFNTTRLPSIAAGSRATIKLKMHSTPDFQPFYFGVWIDFDHNNIFDSGELFMTNNNTTLSPLPTLFESSIWITKTFFIPASAAIGTTRMRIVRTSDPYGEDYSDAFSVPSCIDSTEILYGCAYDFDVIITDPIRPVAGFTASDVEGTTATPFYLTDTSWNTPTSWAWEFTPSTVIYLGGTDATSANPEIQFTAPGTYTARLIATNSAGSDTANRPAYFTISTAVLRPVANFNATDRVGTITTRFTVNDLSLNTPTSWLWTFSPSTYIFIGGTSATSQHPQIQFTAPGNYSAKLVATNASGSDSMFVPDYFNIVPSTLPPIAGFRASARVGTTATLFNLIDTSLHFPTTWRWSFSPATVTFFGGTDASTRNPQVVFNTAGLYTARLYVANSAGADSIAAIDYFNISTFVGIAPIAKFTVNTTAGNSSTVFSFRDSSLNSPTSWSWTFTPNTITYESGSNANSQNPKIKCNARGLYTVKLVVRNAAGVDSLIKVSYLNVGTLGVNNMNNSIVSVYPNPVANTLYCSENCIDCTVEITDMVGHKVLNIDALHQNSIDVSDLSNGLYILKLSGKNVHLTQQISIIK